MAPARSKTTKPQTPPAPPATAEDFVAVQERMTTTIASALQGAESDAPQLGESLERRLSGIEAWKEVQVVRTERLEDRVTELFDGASFFRANMLTKGEFDERQREQGRDMWLIAGVIIGAVALLFTVYGLWTSQRGKAEAVRAAKAESATPPPAPQPIIIQLPPAALPQAK